MRSLDHQQLTNSVFLDFTNDRRHSLGVNDIDAVIKAAEELNFSDTRYRSLLNSISNLPASKKKLKLSIKERIQLLCGAYISLASFVSDEDVETLMMADDKKKQKRIFRKVLKEIEKNTMEIKKFDPFKF